jgi:hypothetical protein
MFADPLFCVLPGVVMHLHQLKQRPFITPLGGVAA